MLFYYIFFYWFADAPLRVNSRFASKIIGVCALLHNVARRKQLPDPLDVVIEEGDDPNFPIDEDAVAVRAHENLVMRIIWINLKLA